MAWAYGRSDVANWCWAAGTLPVVIGLLISMIRDFLAGRMGVDLVPSYQLTPGHKHGRQKMPAAAATTLCQDHKRMEPTLDRLREIADGLDVAEGAGAVTLISEADDMVSRQIVEHEREDERAVYPRVAKFLGRASCGTVPDLLICDLTFTPASWRKCRLWTSSPRCTIPRSRSRHLNTTNGVTQR